MERPTKTTRQDIKKQLKFYSKLFESFSTETPKPKKRYGTQPEPDFEEREILYKEINYGNE